MHPSVTFNPENGLVSIGEGFTLFAGINRERVETGLSNYYRRSIDHRNGYEWLSFGGLKLFEQECGLSTCFYNGRLREIHWSVSLPDAVIENGWPTREAIDQEVSFMRNALGNIFTRTFASGTEQFDWGVVWSTFDNKGFLASSGLRYVT